MIQSHSLQEFSDAIAAIYEAAIDPALWPAAVERIAHLHRTDKAMLFTWELAPQDGGFLFPAGYSERVMLDYGQRYMRHDVWAQATRERNLAVTGTVLLDADLVSDDVLLDSVFYRDFLAYADVRYLCTGNVFGLNEHDYPATVCSVHGAIVRGPFDDGARQLHGLIVNHLSRAVGTMLRLRDAELRTASTLQALDRLPGCVLLLGERGQVLFANVAALRLLDDADGLNLRAGLGTGVALGFLQATTAREHDALRLAINESITVDPLRAVHFTQALKLQRPSGRRPLTVQIAPLSERSVLAHTDRYACAIAFVTDPDDDIALDPALLQKLYQLSPAETRIANQLLRGDALTDIAAALDLSLNTVKTHLQSVFRKTATSRQAELVKLLMSLKA